jgi:hypothetical protein
MDDWRLAVGCADGIVQVADLRRRQVADGKLQAHAVLPAHGERVSEAAAPGIGSGGLWARAVCCKLELASRTTRQVSNA